MANEKLFHIGIKALIVNEANKVLLLQVNTANFKHGDKTVYWDIPGGRVQAGQTVAETLAREVEEEIGTSIASQPEFFTAVVSNIEIPLSATESVGLVLMVYKLSIPKDSRIILSEEHTAFEWVEKPEAARRLAVKYPVEFTDKLNHQ